MIIILASLAALCLSLVIGLVRWSKPAIRDPVETPSSTGSREADKNAPNAPVTADYAAQESDASGQTEEGGIVQCKEG